MSRALTLSFNSDASEKMTWSLSVVISALVYFVALLLGWGAWNQWKNSRSLDLKTLRTQVLTQVKPDVFEQIKSIELKKQQEILLQKEAEASRLKAEQSHRVKQKRIIEKSQKVAVQKKTGLKVDSGARAQDQKLDIPFSELMARSKALAADTSISVAQAPESSQVFNLKPLEQLEVPQGNGQLLQVDRVSGATYEGGLAAHTTAPEGLIFRPAPQEWEIRGGLPLELIQMVVQEHEIQLRYCYELQLLRTPDLQGEVFSQWVITAEGRVTQMRFDSDSFRDSEIFPCLEKKMSTWKFPKPEGGGIVAVKYPMRFSKKEPL